MFNFARFMRVTHSYWPWSASFATACAPNPSIKPLPPVAGTRRKRRAPYLKR